MVAPRFQWHYDTKLFGSGSTGAKSSTKTKRTSDAMKGHWCAEVMADR